MPLHVARLAGCRHARPGAVPDTHCSTGRTARSPRVRRIVGEDASNAAFNPGGIDRGRRKADLIVTDMKRRPIGGRE